MREVTRDQLAASLAGLGIQSGDGLLVHSAIQFLGRPLGGVQTYYAAICAAIGIDEFRNPHASVGTLVVPAFNFGFARGEAFDPQSTPSQKMGVFSEYVRQLPGVLRTPHPLQSLAAVGRWACDLAGRDTLSAFDPGAAFERMLELDFKLLLLGADIQAVSMIHYSEQRASVPYRFWKEFLGQVRTAQGWETRTYRMFVRDLDIDAQLDLSPIQATLAARCQWAAAALNYGQLSVCRLVDFVAAADELLAEDPWALVGNKVEACSRHENKLDTDSR